MENKINGWKIIAIIFIILFILETAFFIWIVSWGLNDLKKEEICSYNICNNAIYDAYQYSDNVCYCYNDGEIVYQEYISS